MPKFGMGKKSRRGQGRGTMGRGPYKTGEDPDLYGKGGIKVRQWRIFRGLTVAELAERANLSTGTISSIEGATSGYGHATLGQLAKALETSVAALFGVNPLKDVEFWSVWDKLDDSQRQRVMDFAMGMLGITKRH